MQRSPELRVSDSERDEVVELLRGHLMAGRLEPDEHEERVEEACRARFGRDLDHALRELPLPAAAPDPLPIPGPPVFVQAQRRDGRPGTALALGLTSLCLVIFTFGIAAFLALPLGIAAWSVGACSARRPPAEVGLTGRNTARTGMWLGVMATLLSVLALGGLGVFFLG